MAVIVAIVLNGRLYRQEYLAVSDGMALDSVYRRSAKPTGLGQGGQHAGPGDRSNVERG